MDFYGRYLWQQIQDEYIILIFDLDEFNRHLFAVFIKIEEYLNPTHPRLTSRPTYTLHGFAYAFKLFEILIFYIWVIETFPNNRIVGTPTLGC
uniref:Uncharacterized protein n=1 Tax=Lactuca sativa TaxID=4236 RepID=A0A9R1ULK4_LACSA|nr:hypothetical protein LSAT_V11C800451270 [Lactuca sativa]